MGNKIPVSVLVIIHSPDLQVLLLERADRPGAWQSVTGSVEQGESLRQTAVRELAEETGLQVQASALLDWRQQNVYGIFPHWRHRYPAHTYANTEHVFSLCLPQVQAVQLAAAEHLQAVWLPWAEAAQKVFSPSNRAAILTLPRRQGLG